MRHTLITCLLAWTLTLCPLPLRSGEWGLEELWFTEALAIGEDSFAVRNVLRFDDPEQNSAPIRVMRIPES
jgi:hypothetical protein